MNYDVIIVGAGPAGIFTAYELKKQKPQSKILLVESGKSIDKRHCPKDKTKKCVSCKPYCHITTGFSGAGAFSDGKLSLSYEVGGDLPELAGADLIQEYINYTDSIYLDFGADTKVEGVGNNEAVKEIRRKAIQGGLKLVDCPIRHLGTEKAQEIYLKIQKHLLNAGVEIKFDTTVKNLLIRNNEVSGVLITDSLTRSNDEEMFSDKVVVATGRKGADWLKDMCIEHKINHSAGPVDIGVRVELRNEVMESVNNVLYESKLIGHPAPFKDKVRTFCQNPGGFVSQENYDNNLAIVNGHSYKDKKSDNTNLAILSSHNFSAPFNEPIEYGQKVAELVNMLGNGKILVQRYGDILDGKRTWEKELYESNVRHTLPDAEAGDLTSAMPYRTMTNILNFIQAMDTVVPGFASRETLLYGPEIKFYSNRIDLDKNFETNIKGLHCLGDSSGWTRGLMMASAMGVIMGRKL
ncbi:MULTISPECIES: NAD(P)/FAD-dependent oxidoreductase [Clostridium]|uniref:FAD-dependent oxidoreductase n=3 Tax=Clostridium TaxID=1485 RepID=A0AAV3W2V8_9CLOT|nr:MULTISPECIES: FAD-dependent oxidoreductase [Clostridium]ALB46870.1 FAD-dependent oxidoreductase [Clostridium beijerinckii NRRL B-598]AVK50870.1 FAD-dependent oxidoreductase [Clostridium sp. MF28]MBC2458376.1 FAD-dependent oxidoreductase [Clostridium beijerinckii]MBC2475785.1 FAD-dependent oxidoreductase [Clostridium beijerinckii]MDG5855426.1 FAD-dependent oxidoreductase [Clostridium beijerinckii]